MAGIGEVDVGTDSKVYRKLLPTVDRHLVGLDGDGERTVASSTAMFRTEIGPSELPFFCL